MPIDALALVLVLLAAFYFTGYAHGRADEFRRHHRRFLQRHPSLIARHHRRPQFPAPPERLNGPN